MTSLADAWRWYEAVQRHAKLARRLVGVHWAELPWSGRLGRDQFFRDLDPDEVTRESSFVTDELADLAVLVLFAVFEAAVREAVLAGVKPEAERLSHPTLRHAAADALAGLEEGSFFRVLEPFKAHGHSDLVEQVNQVRQYRNWVAHGRRGRPRERVSPEMARDRLDRFLSLIQPATPP